MIQSAITISLVPEARGGPFVFWDNLEEACAIAAELGFDAVEIFAPSIERLEQANLPALLQKYSLKLAALGTGGGWVVHKLHLTHPDAAIRQRAIHFVQSFMEFGARFGASAILGSMQGRTEPGVSRDQAFAWIGEGVQMLDETARKLGLPLFLEPLNRYESPFFNRVGDTLQFLDQVNAKQVKILADMFHMNIEETNIAETFAKAGPRVGHVHFVDSNRKAIGLGHIAVEPIARALRQSGFAGYVSAEAIPLPDSKTAAAQTIQSYRKYFQGS